MNKYISWISMSCCGVSDETDERVWDTCEALHSRWIGETVKISWNVHSIPGDGYCIQ